MLVSMLDDYRSIVPVKHKHRCVQCRVRFKCKALGCGNETSVCDKCFQKVVDAPPKVKLDKNGRPPGSTWGGVGSHESWRWRNII